MNCPACGAPAVQQGGAWICTQLCGWSGFFQGAVTVVRRWL